MSPIDWQPIADNIPAVDEFPILVWYEYDNGVEGFLVLDESCDLNINLPIEAWVSLTSP